MQLNRSFFNFLVLSDLCFRAGPAGFRWSESDGAATGTARRRLKGTRTPGRITSTCAPSARSLSNYTSVISFVNVTLAYLWCTWLSSRSGFIGGVLGRLRGSGKWETCCVTACNGNVRYVE